MAKQLNTGVDEAINPLANPLNEANPLNIQDDMLNRVGHMTRMFHDSLRALGVDKMIESVAHEIPDTRERLNYVAKLTQQAAERVLNATDVATPLQVDLADQASALEDRWNAILAHPSLRRDYNEAAQETLLFLTKTAKNTAETKDLLMDIMMAQDFQDLTGQVIKKITTLAAELEQQLVQILVDFSPVTKKEKDTGLLNGPQVNPEAAVNVVANQEQVDDLLDSLGF
jgi:chemotaxis protein CheZ